MMNYAPPLQDMRFLLTQMSGFSHADLDEETVEAILTEAAKLASDVLAPLNRTGDQNGAKLANGKVSTAEGFREAYGQYCAGGWNAVAFPEEYGGQGLPWALAFPIQEMWQGANMAFGLCPLLNQGAVEAILSHGSTTQKEYYLPRLISGEWTGTMNLTEPQAGSDLGLLRAKAEPQPGGHYKISGQKIFITYGEHDYTDNIIHLVLARTPDAPDDVKGISLFIVPKILENGTRNAVECIGLEHKLGIHASPTCTMEFSGATGFLIGEEHQGLKYMFTMMNNARLSVGLQGVAIAERAYQQAQAYANERVQGKSLSGGKRIAIAHHPDVRRMLLSMRSQVEAGRALTYQAAAALDKAEKGDRKAQELVDLLTPVVKAWCTDMAVEVASLGVQIHGGAGFIEEAGAAQLYRDARILPIYEGTNGIQSADLLFRKIVRDKGEALDAYMADLTSRLPKVYKAYFVPLIQKALEISAFLREKAAAGDMDRVAAAAAPYLKGIGLIASGGLLCQAAEKATGQTDKMFAQQKTELAAFFVHNILPFAHGNFDAAREGSAYV